jgi:hypothetical protein
VKFPGLITGVIAGLLLLAGPAPSFGANPRQDAGYSFSGGDGSSPETAVIVHARSESVGVRAEYEWIREHWPGSRRGKQALLGKNNRFYDSLTITDSAGQVRTVYFDITEYFGKL